MRLLRQYIAIRSESSFIGFLVLNIPDLVRIGQDKFDMTFQNDEDRIPKTSSGFYSQPLASVG